MTNLRELNKMIQQGRIKDPKGKGFNICYMGKDVFDKLYEEIDTQLCNFGEENEKFNLIIPSFNWCGVFCIQSELLPSNTTMMGWVEESELKHQKELAGWPL
jgi:hypothetical protein